MKYKTQTLVCLATLAGAFSAVSAFANHEVDNKIRDRVGGLSIDFVDTDLRVKRLSAESSAPKSLFSPVLALTPGYATNPDLSPTASGAYFLGATLDLGYERSDPAAKSVLTAGYEIGTLFFEHSADSNDEVDQVASVSYQQKLDSGLQYRLGVSDSHVEVDYTSVLNVVGGSAEFRCTLVDNLVGGFSYTYQVRDALTPVVTPRNDADAVRQIPAVFLGTDLARYGKGLPQVTLAYSRYWNLADGNDEDFVAKRVALRAFNTQLGLGISADIEASYEDRSGSNLSSLLGGVTSRQDHLTKAVLTLNHDMLYLNSVRASVVVGYERSVSNLATANYRGWTFAATLSRSF
jgi:hypothetical protein